MRPPIYLAYFMSAFFMIIAVICLFAPKDNSWLPGNRRFVMAAVMATYAVIRYYRTRKLSKISE